MLTLMNTLTNMIQLGLFISNASWIIPLNLQGVDHQQMHALFKCIVHPFDANKDEYIMKKRQYVQGQQFDGDRLVQDEHEPFVDVDELPSTYYDVGVLPLTPIIVRK